MNFGGASLSVIFQDRLGRIFPRQYWSRYSHLAASQGFDRLYLLLSFDCDTPEDAEAAVIIDAWLQNHDIQRTYAVPGTMLETNPSIYQTIASKGTEFLNHGYLPHTQQMEGVYRSTTFYSRMESQQVVQDIQRGHQTVTSIIGKKPAGFRAPHFGTVPLQMQRELIRPVLRDLGESFSTQTTAFDAIKHGPIWMDHNWPEFPLVGSTQAPFSMLDSFSYIQSAANRTITDEYSKVLQQTIRQLVDWHICGLLNIYVDPAHVVQNSAFFDSLQEISRAGISSITYTQSMKIKPQENI
ncbi:MAG TPA: polysaccharide deacetylase family protein [Leptolinea sp.]